MPRSFVLLPLLALSCAPASVTPSAPNDAGPSDAAPPKYDDVSSSLEPFRADGGLPGMAGAVVRGDELVALGATGVRKQGDPTPVGLEDTWHLGSDTKAMTATLVGLAVEEGKLTFDTKLPDVFTGATLDPGWANVTIEDLLRHRGGAPGDVPPPIWSQMWSDGAAPGALTKAVLAMLALPPSQKVGNYTYSNAGYMFVGAALEKRYGKSWEELMTTRIFTPLGMSTCGYGAPGSASTVDQPWPHQPGPPPVPVAPGPKADNPRALGPAGTVHCALRDWAKFISLHLAGERGEDRLLKSATIKRLHVPPSGGDYAAGWITGTRPWAGGPILTHAGSNTMNYAVVWIAPAKNVAFMVTTNVGGDVAAKQTDAALGPLIQKYAP
jgi:CubicO group peptidase (beta-lactamase class C family)